MLQAGGIQQGTGAQHLAAGQAGQVGDFAGDQVAGVRDVHEDAVKAGVHDAGDDLRHLQHAVLQFVVPVEVLAQLDVAHGIHDDVAVGQAGQVHGSIQHPVGHKGYGVVQIIGFTDEFLFFDVTKQDFIGDAHHAQRICHMGPNMADSDDPHNAFFHNFVPPGFIVN